VGMLGNSLYGLVANAGLWGGGAATAGCFLGVAVHRIRAAAGYHWPSVWLILDYLLVPLRGWIMAERRMVRLPH